MTGMNAWLDQVLVAVLVLGSVVFAAFRLGPAPMRLWMRRRWARLTGKPMPVVDISGCGNCENAGPRKKSAETRIPVSNIRKLER